MKTQRITLLFVTVFFISQTNSFGQAKDKPIDFGYKMVWFAVSSKDHDKIAEILEIKNKKNCTWQEGIEAIYTSNKIYITPSIGNWTLIAGFGLPNGDSEESVEEVEHILKSLSKQFGEAQFFGTHRTSEFHGWIKATKGEVDRAYVYLGEQLETIVTKGRPTELEQAIKLFDSNSEEAQKESYFDREDIFYPNEEFVMKIAENWSLNPTTLSSRKEISKTKGFLGIIK